MTSLADMEARAATLELEAKSLRQDIAEMKKTPAPCPLELGENVRFTFNTGVYSWGKGDIRVAPDDEHNGYYKVVVETHGWLKENAEKIARGILKQCSKEKVD